MARTFQRLARARYYGVGVASGFIDLTMTPDGSHLAAGLECSDPKYQGNYLLYFGKESENPIWGTRHGGTVFNMAISSDGTHIATINADGYVYSFQNFAFTYRYQILIPLEGSGTLYGSNVAMLSDGTYFVTGANHTISLFSKLSTTPIYEYHGGGFWGSSTGRHCIAIASASGGIYIVASEQIPNRGFDILLFGPTSTSGDWPILIAIVVAVAILVPIGYFVFRKKKSRSTPFLSQPPAPPLPKS